MLLKYVFLPERLRHSLSWSPPWIDLTHFRLELLPISFLRCKFTSPRGLFTRLTTLHFILSLTQVVPNMSRSPCESKFFLVGFGNICDPKRNPILAFWTQQARVLMFKRALSTLTFEIKSSPKLICRANSTVTLCSKRRSSFFLPRTASPCPINGRSSSYRHTVSSHCIIFHRSELMAPYIRSHRIRCPVLLQQILGYDDRSYLLP